MGGEFLSVARRTTSAATVGVRSAKNWSKGYFFTLLTVEYGKIIIFTKNLRFAMGQSREGTIFLHFVGKSDSYVSR